MAALSAAPSRPTITRWITRFERDNSASLADKSSAPHTPARKVWLPVMLEIYHLQKRHPDAGGFRIWSLRGTTDLSVRTVERIMTLNRRVYPDIPHGGRIMDFALDGVKWWSLIVLDGYSR